MEDAVDVLESSLQALYGLMPIMHSSAGSLWTYNAPPDIQSISSTDSARQSTTRISLRVPNTSAGHWNLHASSVWVASVYIADEISSNSNWLSSIFPAKRKKLRVLEIGAGAGLPSIILANLQTNLLQELVISDYPDDGIIRALHENVERNCKGISPESGVVISVVPFDWLSPPTFEIGKGFDLVIGADVLWNSDLHLPLLRSIDRCLKRQTGTVVLLVAGLHTGRYTIQRFIERVGELGTDDKQTLQIDRIEEKEVDGSSVRDWEVGRQEHETEEERRRWVVCIWLRRNEQKH